jgi:phasin family protein
MNTPNFDPNTALESFRDALAPALRAQQEGLKAADRFAHYQYALAGDYLEWTLAHAKAVFSAKSPTELSAKQVELSTQLSDKLKARMQELTGLANDAQATMNQLFSDATAKVAEISKKKAA